MPEKAANSKKMISSILISLKWLALSVGVGIICGALGSALHALIDYTTDLFADMSWLLFLLPVFGIIIALIYKVAKIENSVGTDDVFQAAGSGKPVSALLTPVVLATTALTHIGGGSSGREGAALQIGGSAAQFIGKLLRLPENDVKLVTLCGMSAVFSAAFGTPMAAAVFCVEVLSVGKIKSSAFMPCLMSSFSAFLFSGVLGTEPMRLNVQNIEFGTLPALQALAAGVICAILSIVICRVLHDSKKYFKKFIPNIFLRIATGGVLVMLLTLLIGNRDYNGSGINLLKLAVENGETHYYDFILKLLFTAITLGSGFRGGEIIPTLTVGACFGALFGNIIGMDPSVCALICMVALFCGAVNCPFASVLLGLELTGGANVALIAIACGASFMLSGESSLYGSQEFLFSKLERGRNFLTKIAPGDESGETGDEENKSEG